MSCFFNGVSIHAPRAGCDLFCFGFPTFASGFNSRTPCGVRLPCGTCYACQSKFQFTHPVRGATSSTDFVFNRMYVSIHAPRAGCDLKCNRQVTPLYVSIHAPRAGCDQKSSTNTVLHIRFNSRTPCGVRHRSLYDLCRRTSFNSRTPCGVRRKISPLSETPAAFQFTHPVRGATPSDQSMSGGQYVSIHAPRAGCDSSTSASVRCLAVSIHAPRAGCDFG